MSKILRHINSIIGLEGALLAQQTASAAETTARQAAIDSVLQALLAGDLGNAEALSAHLNGEFAAVKSLLDLVNGDAATDGSWRKGLADVVGMAPEAWNTLGEIAAFIEANPSANITAAVAEQLNTALASIQTTATALTDALAVAEQRLTDEIAQRNEAVAAVASSAVLIKSEALVVAGIDMSVASGISFTGVHYDVIETAFAPQGGVDGIANHKTVRYIDTDGAAYDITVEPYAYAATPGKQFALLADGLVLDGQTVQIQYWHIAG